MISVELLKSYCFPFLFFAVDAMSLFSANLEIWLIFHKAISIYIYELGALSHTLARGQRM